jgi:hypothetical protein
MWSSEVQASFITVEVGWIVMIHSFLTLVILLRYSRKDNEHPLNLL